MQLLASFFSWWYGSGWRNSAERGVTHLSRTTELFSLDLILPTLFSPFRQVSAAKGLGGLNVQLRLFVDRTVSRFVGFMVRIIMLITGLLATIAIGIFWGLWLIIWPFLPLSPVVLCVLAFGGVKL
ncbi:MAG TPA: hypothetical protein VGS28_02840 [Candidatus Saccharimonadales bacterium]|nr:hypothetical protein [Candidatus Saccharimonadales bacterium]